VSEFTIKGVTYRSGKMVGRTQIHVLRRAAPIIEPLFRSLSSGLTPEVAGMVIQGLGALEDEKLDYILDRALAVVQKKEGTGWPSIMSSDGSRIMYEDIRNDGGLQLAICANVLYTNYYPLFLDAPSLFNGGANFPQ
jgi:hypothetical protein